MLPPAGRIPGEADPGQDTKDDLHGTDHDFLAVGPALRILQLNVEGLSAAKRSVISSIADKEKVDIICLEETHVDGDTASRFSITGFDLVSYTLHAKHGRATYVRGNITEAAHVLSTPFCDVIRVGGYHIANVYKPPSESWDSTDVLPVLPHPAVLVGDFNSHHPDWGYQEANPDGDQLQTGLHSTTSNSSMTRSNEVPSTPPDGSETTRLTSVGPRWLMATLSQPPAQSWVTFHIVNIVLP